MQITYLLIETGNKFYSILSILYNKQGRLAGRFEVEWEGELISKSVSKYDCFKLEYIPMKTFLE